MQFKVVDTWDELPANQKEPTLYWIQDEDEYFFGDIGAQVKVRIYKPLGEAIRALFEEEAIYIGCCPPGTQIGRTYQYKKPSPKSTADTTEEWKETWTNKTDAQKWLGEYEKTIPTGDESLDAGNPHQSHLISVIRARVEHNRHFISWPEMKVREERFGY